MGFKLNVNNILRTDAVENLQVGGRYPFQKDELCILADDIQIWLTKKDWTVLAEIQVISQERKNGKTIGIFEVKYLYSGEEQAVLTKILRRMYGWD